MLCMTLIEAKAKLAALDAAISSGEKTIKIAGREVTYFDMADLATEADKLRRDIACKERRNAGNRCVTVATWTGCKA